MCAFFRANDLALPNETSSPNLDSISLTTKKEKRTIKFMDSTWKWARWWNKRIRYNRCISAAWFLTVWSSLLIFFRFISFGIFLLLLFTEARWTNFVSLNSPCSVYSQKYTYKYKYKFTIAKNVSNMKWRKLGIKSQNFNMREWNWKWNCIHLIKFY